MAKEKQEAEMQAKLAEESAAPPLLQTPGEKQTEDPEESSPQLMSTVAESYAAQFAAMQQQLKQSEKGKGGGRKGKARGGA
eukprot:530654-Amphidinium_carterae.1